MRGFCIGVAAAMALTIAGASAQIYDLTYANILGGWCGDTTDYMFTRSALTVTFHSDGSTRVLKVKNYEFSPTRINVIWLDGGNTIFGDYNRSRRSMAQLPNSEGDKGPRRPFHRCR